MGGKAWSEAEIAVLREISEKGLTLQSQLSRLPGRTHDAAKSYASKVGIRLSVAEAWTDAEKSILAEIWNSPVAIKIGLRRLPGRSYEAARGEAWRIGLRGAPGTKGRTGYAWVLPAVAAALKVQPNLPVARIAEITGAGVNSVNRTLRDGHGKQFHISGWVRSSVFGGLAAQWSLGAQQDAEKPGAKPLNLVQKDSKARTRIRAGRFDPFATLISQVAA
ncbi:hypothetical protein P0D71_00470 [Paraburkholderia sp. RL17-383-BIF-A]|uniref:hypothetical protein n=1 Tax=Paraburkholderia sp. RL17-383-BIF-A TaxID=3031631 RepID=UPI0038B8393A